MNGVNQPLITYELVEFEENLVGVKDFRESPFTKRIYGTHLTPIP